MYGNSSLSVCFMKMPASTRRSLLYNLHMIRCYQLIIDPMGSQSHIEETMSGDTDTKFKSCFIVSPLGTDTSVLRNELRQRGILLRDSSTLPNIGYTVLDSIVAVIRSVDFVCAVVDTSVSVPSVMFEIGLAVAFQRPVLLLVGSDVDDLPTSISSLPIARLDPNSRESISLQLDNFLRFSPKRLRLGQVRQSRQSPQIDVGWAMSALADVENSDGNTSESQIQQILAELLRRSGATVVQQPAEMSKGADMAVWIDELSPVVGNPVIIEVKTKSHSMHFQGAVTQLREFIRSSPATLGLLIVEDGYKEQFSDFSPEWPPVIVLGIRELVHLVGRGELIPTITRHRNEAAHGPG